MSRAHSRIQAPFRATYTRAAAKRELFDRLASSACRRRARFDRSVYIDRTIMMGCALSRCGYLDSLEMVLPALLAFLGVGLWASAQVMRKEREVLSVVVELFIFGTVHSGTNLI